MKEEEFKNLIGKDIVVDYNFNGEKQVWSLKNFSIKDGSYQLRCFYSLDKQNVYMDRTFYVTTKHIFKDYKEAVLSISDVLREYKAEQEKAKRESLIPKCENCTHYKENKCFVFPDKELLVENDRIGCMYFKVAEI